ncbi:hypothetical protein T484DRAFT_1761354 [Baffinella frigidus]|nr:hypothetical protein T484DRAFT_1761354 [Cryptophyta sp. CCMP2293]
MPKPVFKWWGLADSLMETYADGFIRGEGVRGEGVGYPAWWLTAVGYANGPPPPPKGKRVRVPRPDAPPLYHCGLD